MKKIAILIWNLFIPLLLFSQDISFTIVDEILLNKGTPHSLSYYDDKLWFFDKTENKIYWVDLQGEKLKEIQPEKSLNGIWFFNDTLWTLTFDINNNKATIDKMLPETGKIDKSIDWQQDNQVEKCEFISVNQNFLFSYIYAGWSSSIAKIDKSGKQISTTPAPGLGSPVGLACRNIDNKVYFLSNLGENENGVLYEFEFGLDNIENTFVSEIPVKNPRGIAFVDENTFFVYSEMDKKIFKLTKSISATTRLYDIKSKEGIKIFPNPAREYVSIHNNEHEITKIDIFSIDGNLLLTFDKYQKLMNISELNTGYYLVLVYTDNGKICKRLIIY